MVASGRRQHLPRAAQQTRGLLARRRAERSAATNGVPVSACWVELKAWHAMDYSPLALEALLACVALAVQPQGRDDASMAVLRRVKGAGQNAKSRLEVLLNYSGTLLSLTLLERRGWRPTPLTNPQAHGQGSWSALVRHTPRIKIYNAQCFAAG